MNREVTQVHTLVQTATSTTCTHSCLPLGMRQVPQLMPASKELFLVIFLVCCGLVSSCLIGGRFGCGCLLSSGLGCGCFGCGCALCCQSSGFCLLRGTL